VRERVLHVAWSDAEICRALRRAGFHRIAVRRGYYPAHGGREDALVLTLAL